MKLLTFSFAMTVLSLGLNIAEARSDLPKAKTVGDVRFVELESNQCHDGLADGLGERGFSITDESDLAQAVLEVKISATGRNLDDLPGFGGVGKKASYTATLVGANHRVLFATSGSEGSINMAELCSDIGDEIADRLRAQIG